MPPHNLTYTVLGAAMLWVGWFGFNAGSELASDGLAASAFCATHFAAAAGTLSWAGMEWLTRGKPSVLGAASGAPHSEHWGVPQQGYQDGPAKYPQSHENRCRHRQKPGSVGVAQEWTLSSRSHTRC